MNRIAAANGMFCVVVLLVLSSSSAWGTVGPGENDFEIDGDYGSTIEANGDITDDGHTTTFVSQGSGRPWEHWLETAYMGLQSYKVRCIASPDTLNDRSEQKILDQWHLNDGVRYFSLAFYVPDFAPTPTDFFQFVCQWWQDPTRQPPLQLSWSSDDHLYLARRTEDTGWDGLYDDGVVARNQWYHFLFAVDFGFDNTGRASMYKMNPATGAWEEKFHSEAITLGWETKPDGTPANTDNFTWKVGTYRGTTPHTTRIYYDNVRYGRLWSIVTKDYLTGYHKNVMRLPFDEGSGRVAFDSSEYGNHGLLMGDPVWQPDGISDGCLEFDGLNDCVRIPTDVVDFDVGNYMTASGWFKTTHSQSGTAILCMDEYSTSYKFRIYLISGDEIAFTVRHPDNTLQYVAAALPGTLFDGQWHHLAGTYNRWAPDGHRLKLYCDGAPVASAEGEDEPLLRGDNYLYIGRFSGEYFRGSIDEPAVYNYAMTDGQVAYLYAQGVGIVTPPAVDGTLSELLSISPNPCGSRAVLAYQLDRAQHVRLSVYDIAGRELIRLVDETRMPGRSTTVWDGRDRHGRRVAQGVYLLCLETQTRRTMRKLTVIR